MKKITTLLLLFLFVGAYSQNLDNYIPKSSTAVVEVSGDQIFELISYTDIEKMMPPGQNGEPMGLNELGFDFASKAYYFYQKNDSITYQNVIVRLSDPIKAEEMIRSVIGVPSTTVHGFNFVMQSNMSVGWDNSIAVFSYADIPKKLFTMDDLLDEKRRENESEEDNSEYGGGLEGDMDTDMLEMELMLKNMSAPYIFSEEELVDRMMAHFSSVLDTSPNESVAQDASYRSGKDKTSSAYFWVNNLDGMMKGMMPEEALSYLPMSENPEISTGLKEITGNLIFGKDEIKLSTNMGIDDKLVESYQKMYDSKMDKAFFKYFDANDVMSYMTFSTDVAKMMKEYPNLLQSMYGSLLPGYDEEMSVAGDLIEVFLDEDAIGELITGDGMILLHDVEEQEVTFKTFEYDEDFNATEVEKTKMEPLPMFTVMLGSKNQKIINKLMKLTRKYKVAEYVDGHHRIMAKDMGAPFDVYFTYKDGIAFLTNSDSRLANYKVGKKICNLGNHKKNLKNNIFNMYLNTTATVDKLSSMIPADPSTLNYMKNNFKEIQMTMGQMKGNKVGYDVIMKTSENSGNALKLLLDTVNHFSGSM